MLRLLVCVNDRPGSRQPSCAGRGSRALVEAFRDALAEAAPGLEVVTIRCFGQCERGPNVRLAPGGRFWRGVRIADVPDIVAAVLANPEVPPAA